MKSTTLIELMVFIGCLSILLYRLSPMLLTKQATFLADHISWGYPVFQYFAESIINGVFPLWNPFSHGGEPFYPILLQIRLIEPITLLAVLAIKWITLDIVLMYNWIHFIQAIVMLIGVYLLLRPIAHHCFTRLALIPVLLFLSFFFSTFRQPATVHQFLWVPYILLFLFRILYREDLRWHNWLFIGGLIGVNWQSYFFSGVWVLLLFVLISFMVLERDRVKSLIHAQSVYLKIFTALMIIAVMMLPNLLLLHEKNRYLFPLRTIPEITKETDPMGHPFQFEARTLPKSGSIIMPYRMIEYTGTFVSIWDFIKIVSPESSELFSNGELWLEFGSSSEIYFYIGLLPWGLAVIGLFLGKHEQKKIWVAMALGFGLFLLGPSGGIHRILYYIFPPVWFVRHTHGFVFFFTVTIVYFYVIGMNYLGMIWNQEPVSGNRCFARATNRSSEEALPHVKIYRSWGGVGLFIACYISSLYIMTRLTHPWNNLLFIFIIFVIVICVILIPKIGSTGVVFGIISGHIFSVILFQYEYFVDSTDFTIYTLILLGVPATVFFIFQKGGESVRRRGFSIGLITAVFLASLSTDIFNHLKATNHLYESKSHPRLKFNLETNVQKLKLPHTRKALLTQPTDDSTMRYISLIYRDLYAFSPIHPLDNRNVEANKRESGRFEAAMTSQRWNSFFLLRRYFELIHSDIPIPALREFFAIDKDIFQFKKQGIIANDKEMISILNELEPGRIVPLLEEHVFISPPTGDPLSQTSQGSSLFSSPEMLSTNEVEITRTSQNSFSYSITDYRINRLDLEVKTGSKGLLYWSDGFDERWKVYVNGKREEVLRANSNFKAVVIPEGSSELRFIYNHASFLGALVVFWTTFIVCVSVGTISWLLSKH